MFMEQASAQVDWVANGQGQGPVARYLMQFEPGLKRPFKGDDGHDRVIVNTGRWTVEKGERRPIRESRRIVDLVNSGKVPVGLVANATALRKEEWIQLDTVIEREARYRLVAWADLSAACPFGGFNGMAKTVLEYEAMSDPGEAVVDMDGRTPGRTDAPRFQLRGLPLPITHSDFTFSSRFLAESRNTGTPIDTTMGEAAGRRVAETIEKTLIGNQTGMLYGGNSTQVGGYDVASQVFGYTNFPFRIAKTGGYKPTGNGRSGTGWVPGDTLKDVLGYLDALKASKFYGPFMLYHSNDWDQYLDNDYIVTAGAGNVAGLTTQTLRNRLRSIQGITDVKRLDFMFSSVPVTNTTASNYTGPGGENVNAAMPFRMVLVQMTPDVAQAVNGLDITTVQWENRGGLEISFVVLCIQVPRLRATFSGLTGILDATATL